VGVGIVEVVGTDCCVVLRSAVEEAAEKRGD
jgi:hypothetical protein